jgi:outer membrane protein TolC
LKRCPKTLFLAVLTLTGCATDELALAPSAPDRPWVIPPTSGAPSRPVAVPAKEPRPGAAAPPLVGTPAEAADYAMADSSGSRIGTGEINRGNAVAIDRARQYDLAALIDLAQRNNPETREAWERARQAALAVGLVESTYVPQISAEIISGYQTTPLPIPKDLIPRGWFRADTRELIPLLAAKWLLFDFGRRAGAEQEARANAFVANVQFTGVHHKLIYAVSRDYFALGAARARLHVTEQALKTAGIVQDAAEMRRANGLATVVEVAQARRQTAQARFDLERAKGAEHAAYAALIASVGIAPNTVVQVADSSGQPLPPEPSGDVDQLLRDALANRPDIIAALGKIKAAEATLNSANANYYPTISLVAKVYENVGSLSTDGSPYYSVYKPGASILLKLDWPLFDGGAREARVAAARSEISAAQASLDHAKDAAEQQVTDAYDALKTGFAEHSAALTLTEAAQTAYDAALEAYRNGVGTYTDLVNAETALTQAQSERVTAHANVFTAAAALAFATGSMLSQP